jgi:hypothetical protein
VGERDSFRESAIQMATGNQQKYLTPYRLLHLLLAFVWVTDVEIPNSFSSWMTGEGNSCPDESENFDPRIFC